MNTTINNISPVMFDDKQMQAAARNLCVLRGLDPDGAVQLPANAVLVNRVPDQTVFVPRWNLCGQEIEHFMNIYTAIVSVIGSTELRQLSLAEYEKAGRQLAVLRNVDQDAAIQVPLDSILSPWKDQELKSVKRWELYAVELKQFLNIHEAIQRVGKVAE